MLFLNPVPCFLANRHVRWAGRPPRTWGLGTHFSAEPEGTPFRHTHTDSAATQPCLKAATESASTTAGTATLADFTHQDRHWVQHATSGCG